MPVTDALGTANMAATVGLRQGDDECDHGEEANTIALGNTLLSSITLFFFFGICLSCSLSKLSLFLQLLQFLHVFLSFLT